MYTVQMVSGTVEIVKPVGYLVIYKQANKIYSKCCEIPDILKKVKRKLNQ